MIEFKTSGAVVVAYKDDREVMRLYNMVCAKQVEYYPYMLSVGVQMNSDDLRDIATKLDSLNGFLQ